MANTFKNATLSLTTLSLTAYTCPSNTQAIVHSIYFGNTNGNTATVSINLYDDSKNTTFNIGTALPIPVGSSLYFDKPINLEADDELRVSADEDGDVEMVASILEIT